MACPTWQTQLDAYVDAELQADQMRALDEHLRSCPSCALETANRIRQKHATRLAGARFQAAPEFRARMMKQLKPEPRKSWIRTWAPAFAATAALVILMFAAVAQWQSSRQQAFAELADLHVATLASSTPVDVVSSDRHTVKPWFQGKLPFTFNLPELAGTPFTLVGGRMAYFHQSPGAQLIYAVRKHEISVFIFQDRGELGSFGVSGRQTTFTTETWASGGLRYFVISDVGAEDVKAITQMLKKAAGAAD